MYFKAYTVYLDLGMQVNNSTEVGIGSTGLGFKVNF
ncbi:hypothetical protein KX01_1258 [Francisella frigiditurris]|uniref:Uncharacterized protein n=1 Tax=Francisella frigiditurris TaxID=1542390 RepID=A0A1J0KTY8_9GAMM|nr:hypothetical protein KX01_1258 [Francisella frigiditurris]